MIPAHFAGAHVGHVRKRDGRITFEPLAVTTDAWARRRVYQL